MITLGGLLGLALAAIAIVAWALSRERRRARVMESVGARLGLRYVGRGTGLETRLSEIASVASMSRQRFSHLLEGETELICDWSTIHPLEKRRRVRHQTLLAVRSEGAAWPPFRIVPSATPIPGLAGFAGSVVEFPDPVLFDQRFRVEAPDHDRILERLSSERRKGLVPPDGLVLEGGGEWLVAYRPRRRLAPQELMRLREQLAICADRLA